MTHRSVAYIDSLMSRGVNPLQPSFIILIPSSSFPSFSIPLPTFLSLFFILLLLLLVPILRRMRPARRWRPPPHPSLPPRTKWKKPKLRSPWKPLTPSLRRSVKKQSPTESPVDIEAPFFLRKGQSFFRLPSNQLKTYVRDPPKL